MNSNLFHLIASYLEDDWDFDALHRTDETIVCSKDQQYHNIYKYLGEIEDELTYYDADDSFEFSEQFKSYRFSWTRNFMYNYRIFTLLKILQVIVEFDIGNHSKSIVPIQSYLIKNILYQNPRKQPKLRSHKTHRKQTHLKYSHYEPGIRRIYTSWIYVLRKELNPYSNFTTIHETSFSIIYNIPLQLYDNLISAKRYNLLALLG
jgi:hypothetical protein